VAPFVFRLLILPSVTVVAFILTDGFTMLIRVAALFAAAVTFPAFVFAVFRLLRELFLPPKPEHPNPGESDAGGGVRNRSPAHPAPVRLARHHAAFRRCRILQLSRRARPADRPLFRTSARPCRPRFRERRPPRRPEKNPQVRPHRTDSRFEEAAHRFIVFRCSNGSKALLHRGGRRLAIVRRRRKHIWKRQVRMV